MKSGGEDIAARVTSYARAGAAAVSVLTEPDRFEGSLDHLEQAARALQAAGGVPAMRKDFLVDPYQVAEARLAGAGGILVIVRMLTRGELDALIVAARELGLFVLIEAFDAADVAIAKELLAMHGSRVKLLIGINSRDLTELTVVPAGSKSWWRRFPSALPRVAESGVATPEDAARPGARRLRPGADRQCADDHAGSGRLAVFHDRSRTRSTLKCPASSKSAA